MKNMRIAIGAGLLAIAVVLAGCESNRERGALIGGTSGAAIGSIISGGGAAGTVIGALAGIIVGSEIGYRMDEHDRRHIARSLETAPSGQQTQWVNPDNGREFGVTPQQPYTNSQGQPCREFVVTSDEFNNPVTGVACRQSDGTWKMQD